LLTIIAGKLNWPNYSGRLALAFDFLATSRGRREAPNARGRSGWLLGAFPSDSL
jgi:hypothetical protein